jgi:hypothetical protein
MLLPFAWLGHLVRMDQGQMVKNYLMGNWEEGGGQADPDRWPDDVEAGLRTMGIKR